MVVVACRATSTSVEDVAKMTSTFSRDQLGRKLAEPVHHFCPAEVDDNVLALEIAKIAKAGPQCLHPVRGGGSSPET